MTKNRRGDNYHRLIILSDLLPYPVKVFIPSYRITIYPIERETREKLNINAIRSGLPSACLRDGAASGLTTIMQQCLMQVCKIY